MNVTYFLKELNQLYSFLDTDKTKLHTAHALDYDSYSASTRMPFKFCPACNSELKGHPDTELVQKIFSYDDFPYFPVGAIDAFEGDTTNLLAFHEIYWELSPFIKENYPRMEVSLRVNHSGSCYNMARFALYEQMLAHFSRSMYFSRELLEETFRADDSYSRPHLNLEGYLRTLYCHNCSDDIFLVLTPSFYQNITTGTFELTLPQMKYFYTMIANAVAFSACFAVDAYIENSIPVKKTLSAYSFVPVLKPTALL